MIPWQHPPSPLTPQQTQALAHARRKLGIAEHAPLPRWVAQLAHQPAFLMDILNSFAQVLLKSGHLETQTVWCIAVAMANHLRHEDMLNTLVEMAQRADVGTGALSEAVALCASTVGFNMQHAFRGYVDDAQFESLRVGLRRSISQAPEIGHHAAHLISVVVSVHSGCKRCVRYHTAQAMEAGATPEQINQAMQIGAIIASLCSFVGPR